MGIMERLSIGRYRNWLIKRGRAIDPCWSDIAVLNGPFRNRFQKFSALSSFLERNKSILFVSINRCIINLCSLSPLFGTKFLGLEVSSLFFDHDKKRTFHDGQYVDIIGFALRFERAAWKNARETFLSLSFFSATIDAKSSNCGLVNAKFGTGQFLNPSCAFGNVLQQRVRFLLYRLWPGFSDPPSNCSKIEIETLVHLFLYSLV